MDPPACFRIGRDDEDIAQVHAVGESLDNALKGALKRWVFAGESQMEFHVDYLEREERTLAAEPRRSTMTLAPFVSRGRLTVERMWDRIATAVTP